MLQLRSIAKNLSFNLHLSPKRKASASAASSSTTASTAEHTHVQREDSKSTDPRVLLRRTRSDQHLHTGFRARLQRNHTAANLPALPGGFPDTSDETPEDLDQENQHQDPESTFPTSDTRPDKPNPDDLRPPLSAGTTRKTESTDRQVSERDDTGTAGSGLSHSILPLDQVFVSLSDENNTALLHHNTVESRPHSPVLSVSEPPAFAQEQNERITNMQRKVWVRRPGASATLIVVNNADLADAVRDVILQKYANSLGKNIDSPDITLKIRSRESRDKGAPLERVLQPDEVIGETFDLYYPGGQTLQEALIIDIPLRKTPKQSPRLNGYHIPYGQPHHAPYPYYIDNRPGEDATEYFPSVPARSPGPNVVNHLQQPQIPHQLDPRHPHPYQNGVHPHMSVLNTGHLPIIPSPGADSLRRKTRPKYGRQHTSSPTIIHSIGANHVNHINGSESQKSQINGVASAAPLPTPPAQLENRSSITPPNRVSSPQPGQRPKRKKPLSQQPSAAKVPSITGDPAPLPQNPLGLGSTQVPAINVLLVEDNVINLSLLEKFMRKLKVRWKTAANGREAVNTWRKGGFHLVLMDIQMPIMNGHEATKEIRRLESVNGIGLGITGGQRSRSEGEHIAEDDKLINRSLFKSPVIIVALTASSLQSDRHEALAAGCNDFLTKPVAYPWMERKVTEWGSMQALVDWEGWRKWKYDAANENAGLTEEQKKAKEKKEKADKRAEMLKAFKAGPPSLKKDASSASAKSDDKDKIKVKTPTTATNGDAAIKPAHGGAKRTARRGGSSGGSNMLETHPEEEDDDQAATREQVQNQTHEPPALAPLEQVLSEVSEAESSLYGY